MVEDDAAVVTVALVVAVILAVALLWGQMWSYLARDAFSVLGV